MRQEDLDVLRRKISEWMQTCKPKSILVMSPTAEEFQIVNACNSIGAKVESADRARLNLDHPVPQDVRSDVLVCNNTLMYSDDRKRWAKRMSEVARYLWLQDGVEGVRGNDGNYLGEDGDRMRFKFEPHWTSDYPHAEDLADLFGADAVLDHEVYGLDPDPGKHFVALIDLRKMASQDLQPQAPRKKKNP